ncbi:pLS20_p028 family conjugation system transmembrane protein [Sporosarcina sp. P1]|uniref:pLS20_p028 family conjugation system transmembrane protein n=1 Tax=Sporosarcina sp. P1 TaxID=2048257 RepID=UPI000C171C5B|nr:hypothetical protein [Sporosarcina sp. P1]PIC83301.1 hypothetical protein CSV73_08610 [Sporosarcina sp. P1]
MSNEEIARKLEEFQDYLSISSIFTDIFRWIAWAFVQGLAWIVDALENLTDDILLIKSFYNHPEIVAFVDTIKPILYIFLAFSLLYTGYLLIFQKKFNREGIAINLFIACIIILSLNTGMDKASEFTDVAIDAIKVESLFANDESTLSGSIIQRNVNDLTEIDKCNWSTTELTVPNSTPPSRIANINVSEKYGKDTDGIPSEGQDISKYMLSLNNVGEYRAEKFDQSGLEWNNEYYFRYSINWFTIFVTLGIIAFTLFSIALKLAKLFFELTFNYILALIVAPADIHDGQKTKKIIQTILNTFFATILIFLSMKVYMIGTAYLESTLSPLPYLIALIAFSIAVVDGPNIVERLFGIDAGLKNGWGVLAGAYACGKMASGLGKGLSSLIKDGSAESKFQQQKSSRLGNEKAPSPNGSKEDGEEADNTAKASSGSIAGIQNSKSIGDSSTKQSGESNATGTTNEIGTASISSQLDSEQGETRTQTKAPSPNDAERATLSQQSQGGTGDIPTMGGPNSGQRTQGVQESSVQRDTNLTSVSDQVQGNSSVSKVNSGGASSPSAAGHSNEPLSGVTSPTTRSSNSVQRAQGIQQSSVRTDTDITSIADQSQGNTTVRITQSGSTRAHLKRTHQANLVILRL